MSVKVAINGFGRIGRLAFRQMFGAEGYEVAEAVHRTLGNADLRLLSPEISGSGHGNTASSGKTI